MDPVNPLPMGLAFGAAVAIFLIGVIHLCIAWTRELQYHPWTRELQYQPWLWGGYFTVFLLGFIVIFILWAHDKTIIFYQLVLELPWIQGLSIEVYYSWHILGLYRLTFDSAKRTWGFCQYFIGIVAVISVALHLCSLHTAELWPEAVKALTFVGSPIFHTLVVVVLTSGIYKSKILRSRYFATVVGSYTVAVTSDACLIRFYHRSPNVPTYHLLRCLQEIIVISIPLFSRIWRSFAAILALRETQSPLPIDTEQIREIPKTCSVEERISYAAILALRETQSPLPIDTEQIREIPETCSVEGRTSYSGVTLTSARSQADTDTECWKQIQEIFIIRKSIDGVTVEALVQRSSMEEQNKLEVTAVDWRALHSWGSRVKELVGEDAYELAAKLSRLEGGNGCLIFVGRDIREIFPSCGSGGHLPCQCGEF